MLIDSLQSLYYVYMVNPHKRIIDSASKFAVCRGYVFYQLDRIDKDAEVVSRTVMRRSRDIGRLVYETVIDLNHGALRRTEEDALFVSITDDLVFAVPLREWLNNKQILVEWF